MNDLAKLNTFLEKIDIKIHDDLKGLLWIGDGDAKNYEFAESTKLLNAYGLGSFGCQEEEPSAIYTSLVCDFQKCEPAQSWQSYAERTPRQRGSFLKYLEYPYSTRAKESDCTLLLYGLERRLATNEWQKPLEVIKNLKDAFMGKHFGDLCAQTIVNFAIHKKDPSLLECVDFNSHYIHHEPFLLCAHELGFPILPKKLLDFANFSFPNRRYIDGERRMFLSRLEKVLLMETGYNYLKVSDISLDNLPAVDLAIYQNKSLRFKHRLKYPDLTKSPFLTMSLKHLFSTAHEDVKKALAKKRKPKSKTVVPHPNEELVERLAEEASKN